MNDNTKQDIARIERNLKTAAKIVDRYGEKYLLLFKRVDAEHQKATGERDTLNRIRELAA